MSRWILVVGLLAFVALGVGQAPQIGAVRCHQPPKLNGDLEDPGWAGAPVAERFVDQYTNHPVDDQTAVRMVYDDAAIYVAFHCHDSHPEQIVGREVVPEAQFNGEDTVTLEIDPYNTRSGSSVSRFTVNAINTRTESIAGGHSSKAEWRGIWDSFVKRVPDGYVVEMRIPWQILQYPHPGHPVDMDLNFDRYQPRTKTFSQWAYVTPSYRAELLGLWKGVETPAKDARTRLQFLAYDAPSYDEGKFSNRAGLDMRYAVSNQQTALVSLNPDFINIEQQIAGINFVHTERFLNDARPFFTEGGDYFNPIGQFEWGIPFYSQRIGPIDAGAKFYGQLSRDAKIGVLSVAQADGSTAAFTNYRLNLGSTFSQSIFASSFDGQNQHDRLAGTIVNKRWGNFFAAFDGAVEDKQTSVETAGNVSAGYTGSKLFSEILGMWVDPSFDPPLAYVPWQGRHGFYTYTNYSDTFPKGPLHDWNVFLYTPDFYTVQHQAQERGIQPGVNVTTRNDQAISLNRSMTDYISGSDNYYDLSYTFNASNRFRQFGVEYLFGEQGGEPARFIDVKGSLRAFRRIDLGFEQSVLDLQGTARQTVATIGWQLDARRSLTGRFVSTNGQTNFFLSYQSAGWTGTEIYFILGDPNAATFTRRVSLKFVWAF